MTWLRGLLLPLNGGRPLIPTLFLCLFCLKSVTLLNLGPELRNRSHQFQSLALFNGLRIYSYGKLQCRLQM